MLRARLLALPLLATACGTEAPPFEPWTLADLTAEEGFSLRIPERYLDPGDETQDCYFVEAPDINDGQPYYVSRVHTAINPGSHHFNVFRVRTLINLRPEMGVPTEINGYAATVVQGDQTDYYSPCWDSSNWSDWPLVANSQNSNPKDPYTDWVLPEGVAIRFEPGELLMLQPHFVNASTQKTPHGLKAGINFHLYDQPAAPQEMGTLFATQQSIRICRSQPESSFSGTCKFPAGSNATITAANGHFHSRGLKFSMYTWDGRTITQPSEADRFYVSNNWNDPPMVRDLAVPAPDNGGIWWTCDYRWREPEIGCDAVNARDMQQANDCCYTFGAGVETQEHCNVFVYYYPKGAGEGVFCN